MAVTRETKVEFAAPSKLVVATWNDRPFDVYRRLMGRVLAYKVRLTFAMVSLGLSAVATLSIPWLASEVFQEAALQHDMLGIQRTLACVLFAAAVMAVCRFVAEDQIGLISLRTMEQLRNDLVAKLLRLPLSYHQRSKTGESVSRNSNDVLLLQSFTYDSLFSLGSDLLQVAGSVAFLIYLNWQLTLVLLAIVPIGALAVGMASKWVRRWVANLQARQAQMTGLLTEQLIAVPAIQAFDAAEFETRRFGELSATYTRDGRASIRTSAGTRSLVNFLGVVAIVFVLVCGLQGLDLNNTSELKDLVKFALFGALIADPLTRITRTIFEIQRALAAGGRVFDLIDHPIEADHGRKELAVRVDGDLEFRQVDFAYRVQEPILRNVSLSIPRGQMVAIVGSSGCGKSTLASMVLRFNEPTSGEVLLDGVPLGELKLASLRQHIGWMGQEPLLISGTIADNIRYGRRSASMEDIKDAARLVAADDFIRDLPKGYESMIGERGVDLSGGQRARISMARVVLRSPEIVIFDESTAALDTDTEMLLWRRLRDWMNQRTTIIIAHRLLTILDAPRVIVLEAGRVVGDGSVHHLHETCPAFRRLFAEQMNLAPKAA